ncbi:hypothetical protein ACXAT3_002633 [Clostridium sporogenes]
MILKIILVAIISTLLMLIGRKIKDSITKIDDYSIGLIFGLAIYFISVMILV